MTGLTRGLMLGLLGALLAGPVLARTGGSEVWMDDLGEALEVARRLDKDLLVDFTGSDWCSWCIRLDREVFAKPAFLEYAEEKYVLVALDFPRENGELWKKLGAEQRDRNRDEQMRYKVQGFPSILLLTPDGVRYGKTGYQKGGPAAYTKHLEDMRVGAGLRVRRDVETLRTASAPVDSRLAAGYALIGDVRDELREEILDLVRTEDPEDSGGLLAEDQVRTIFRKHLETDTPDLQAAARELDAMRAASPAVDAVAQYQFARAWIALGLEDLATARRCTAGLAQLEDRQPGMVTWLEERIAALEDAGSGSEASADATQDP